ncbi:polysaccharide deacetylase [Flavobacterium cauense R2A-7]|uniref:Peptidoglycan/xylan/chitin deacetylase (PgdA/CDA1 family) n=1 Tax=Flavobacterium cauense R2A-7 TaxID=1341154 RepID=V6S0U7_9FLAO|nr:polysaccharide deacetylase family protein [Flavobacterium cauense]ESU20024.1 polysaccharide deacetylase [Flavobacterium cauense R2A-7]KGO83830.1 polysaccharide deacetylase [Flavobacterium cauense R2A-7]TWI12449.1 peptidoglycan/xylan/chitin deacetylase (PgdA/CDA1 family) [Flavobacterium cauense R2A-7]
MDFYWIKTNRIIKQLFSKQIWDLPNTEKKVYLTFDDGPTPEVTEWVLSLLKAHNIKATFFCIGDNIRKYPEIFKQVVAEGHRFGNHTYNHLQGWKTNNKEYLMNTIACEKEMEQFELNRSQTKLFRPPYGKIGAIQAAKLRKLGYKIIMWDVLSADFDVQISPEECLKNVVSNTTQGSIIVFHDSRKAFKNLEYTLPETIAILKEKGFVFDTID